MRFCIYRRSEKQRNSGVTVIELIVVASVVSILAVALGFSFVGWQGGYSVEATIKELYSDLVDARRRGITEHTRYFAVIPTFTTYSLIEDIDDDGDNTDPPDIALPTFPKTVDYTMTLTNADIIEFDTRGIIWPMQLPLSGTICIFTDFDGDGVSDTNPDYDCIVISQTSINMGQLTTQNTAGGLCDSANCDAR